MKNFIKAPENWGKKEEVKAENKVAALRAAVVVDPNRARIEAKIAEIKEALQAKNKK